MPTVPAPAAPPPFPVGGIYLDNVRFTTDPETYEPLTWEKRYSIHQGIGGRVTIQDFGVYAKDCKIIMASGNARFLDELSVIAFHTKWRTRGATFELRDWMANNFTVFLMTFPPINFKPNMYRYKLEAQVVAINTLWNTTYTGT